MDLWAPKKRGNKHSSALRACIAILHTLNMYTYAKEAGGDEKLMEGGLNLWSGCSRAGRGINNLRIAMKPAGAAPQPLVSPAGFHDYIIHSQYVHTRERAQRRRTGYGRESQYVVSVWSGCSRAGRGINKLRIAMKPAGAATKPLVNPAVLYNHISVCIYTSGHGHSIRAHASGQYVVMLVN